MGPLVAYFKLQALQVSYFAWLCVILVAFCALTTVVKQFYIRRFGWQ